MPVPEVVSAKVAALPARPGCYVFRDAAGGALYIGKAKSLRARVKSYFQAGSSDARGFIPWLREKVADLETVVTATEKEAAILENSLIKENRPRYNIKLRDDKEFLTLKIAPDHAFPRLELVRRPAADSARYFGPYHSATAARRTLHLVEKHFQLRTCSDRELASRRRPCLQYQIKRCPGPCVYDIDGDLYGQQVRAVGLFLEGRHDELSAELKERMAGAAERYDYELAAVYRDQLRAVESVRQAQRVVAITDRDQDVLGLYREGDLLELSLLSVRAGRVVDAASFSFSRLEIPNDEVVATFLREHYGDEGRGAMFVPDEILVPEAPEGSEGVGEWLTERREALTGKSRKVEVLAPVRGTKKKLLELATENARHAFEEKRRAADDIDERLARLQQKLRLPTLPRRIECCDISHLGGSDTVGAIVAFLHGVPDKKRYRTYRVKSVADGDDYGAMMEVLSRRFRRGRLAQQAEAEPASEAPADATDTDPVEPSSEVAPATEGEWDLPDLFVVDGGRGQLAVALTAARDLGLHELAIVGLAKERETVLGEKLVDRVYLPGQKNPVALRANSPELFLLTRARDEAHRFANRGRKKAGTKRQLSSSLDSVRGIGPKTRKALLSRLGSVARIRVASDEQLLAVPGMTAPRVKALRDHFAKLEAASTTPEAD